MRPAKVTQVGAGSSAWLPLDPYPQAHSLGAFAKITAGTPTYTVEVTPDNVFDPTVTPTAYPTGVAALTAATTTQAGSVTLIARAVRVTVTGSGTVELTVVSPGVI